MNGPITTVKSIDEDDLEITEDRSLHDGCVHIGLRYSAYLRFVSPNAHVILFRNDIDSTNPSLSSVLEIEQIIIIRFLRIPIWKRIRSLSEIIELAIDKIQEYDIAVETYSPE